MKRQHHVGIDENGVGPRLGPLVVTAVWASATEEKWLTRPLRGGLGQRIGDSKELMRFGHGARGESWARVLMERATGAAPRDPAELLAHLLGRDQVTTLQALCPRGGGGQCWEEAHDRFVCTDEQVDEARADLRALEKRGVELHRAWVTNLCTMQLNQAADRGASRLLLDLRAIEQHAARARDAANAQVHTIAGKVGGYEFYLPHLQTRPLPKATLESRAKSVYTLHDGSTLTFAQDADARYPLVSLASLVGKWVRDLVMVRISRFHEPADRGHEPVSGYHDPVTQAFVQRTAAARAAAAFSPDCFERRKAARAQLSLLS